MDRKYRVLTQQHADALRYLMTHYRHKYFFEAETEAEKAFARNDMQALAAACVELGLVDDDRILEAYGLADGR